ncbi:MAG: methyltransferase domain-containing protein [Patescibacteria group bacterium]
MLKNYVIAQWGPFIVDHPEYISEDFYSEIVEEAKKYIRADSNVLDVGCATGRLVFEYEKLGARSAVGIDTSSKLIDFCKKIKEKQVQKISYPFDSRVSIFIEGDVVLVDFKDKFSFLSCVNVIDRAENPILLIRKCFDLLKMGGVALFVSPYDWDFSPAPKHLHVSDMKNLFDLRRWEIIGEKWLSLNMPIEKETKLYDCHLVVVRKIFS